MVIEIWVGGGMVDALAIFGGSVVVMVWLVGIWVGGGMGGNLALFGCCVVSMVWLVGVTVCVFVLCGIREDWSFVKRVWRVLWIWLSLLLKWSILDS